MTIRLFLPVMILFISVHAKITAQTIVVKGVAPKGTMIKKTTVIQPSYNIQQITGKWQETKRTAISTNTKVAFSDTLQLNFNKRDSVIVRDGISMSQKGYAAVDGANKLQVAGNTYTIVSLSKNTLVINDGEFIRELQKRKMFYYETLGRIIVPKENLSDPVTIDVKKVMGKWDVYRTQASPGAAEDSAIIKHLSFLQLNDDGSVSGEVTFTKAKNTESLPFKAIFEKGILQLQTLKHSWSIYTYKADGKEFVFGQQGGLVYFAKQL